MRYVALTNPTKLSIPTYKSLTLRFFQHKTTERSLLGYVALTNPTKLSIPTYKSLTLRFFQHKTTERSLY
jgi:hypothetical protein